ncbi:hypothetical protein K491DRAFT_738771, partial [Lophiostoma macrostomum CBS 122681]
HRNFISFHRSARSNGEDSFSLGAESNLGQLGVAAHAPVDLKGRRGLQHRAPRSLQSMMPISGSAWPPVPSTPCPVTQEKHVRLPQSGIFISRSPPLLPLSTPRTPSSSAFLTSGPAKIGMTAAPTTSSEKRKDFSSAYTMIETSTPSKLQRTSSEMHWSQMQHAAPAPMGLEPLAQYAQAISKLSFHWSSPADYWTLSSSEQFRQSPYSHEPFPSFPRPPPSVMHYGQHVATFTQPVAPAPMSYDPQSFTFMQPLTPVFMNFGNTPAYAESSGQNPTSYQSYLIHPHYGIQPATDVYAAAAPSTQGTPYADNLMFSTHGQLFDGSAFRRAIRTIYETCDVVRRVFILWMSLAFTKRTLLLLSATH